MADPVKVEVDLEAGSLYGPPEVEQQQAEEKDVVFCPFKDIELVVNNERLKFVANVPKKVSRDQARILLDAAAGYIRE